MKQKISLFLLLFMPTLSFCQRSSSRGYITLIKTNTLKETRIINTSTGQTSSSMDISTSFAFSINNGPYQGIGRRGANLIPYFKDCPKATMLLNLMRKQLVIETVTKITGGLMVLPGGLITALAEDKKTVGIGLLAGGGALLVTGLIMQKKSDKNLYKSVNAYNNCDIEKTGYFKKLIPSSYTIFSETNFINKNISGLKFAWTINN